MQLKDKISRVKQSRDARTLVANFGYLSLLQMAGYVFPLFTLPYLARVIGADGFGKIAFASAIMVWFETIADWGFNYTATRDVAQNRDNKERVSEIFSTVFWGRFILILASFCLLLTLIAVVPKFRDNAAILLVTFIQIPGHALLPQWFFQGLERMKYITWFTLLVKLLFTVTVFIFVKDRSDYIIQPLLLSLGFMVSGLISMYMIVFKWKYSLHRVSLRAVFRTIKSSTNVFINNLAPNLYNSFAIVLLGIYAGPIHNGIYDAGKKFVTISDNFLMIVTRVMFPYLVRKQDRHKDYAKLSLLSACAISFVLFLFAPVIIKLVFGQEFIESINVLRILSFALPFIIMFYVYGTNYLVVVGEDRTIRNVTLTASVIGFIIAFPLIYYYSYIGTSITYVIANGLLGLGSFIFAKKTSTYNSIKKRL